jgi:hypothetical protein
MFSMTALVPEMISRRLFNSLVIAVVEWTGRSGAGGSMSMK